MFKNAKSIHVLSGLVPVVIFIIHSIFHNFIPFGQQILNIYDSFTQYQGMIIELKNAILHFNFFYSYHVGLGFNLFGSLAYYAASPLNLLSIFATSENYPFFSMFMIYLRFFLLGFASSIYFGDKTNKISYIVMFSTIYALMGYCVTYYYNYIWMDSIILLPLVALGLERLVNDKNPKLYIIFLSLCIICNYYIGYMVCIFSILFFIYLISDKKNKLDHLKRFIQASIICGLIGLIVILPSFYALRTGKASLYDRTDYTGFIDSGKMLLYSMTPGVYESGDQSYGPPQVYCSILVIVLTVFYFFNTKFSTKEKIATFLILVFFVLSFNITALNYAWQFFQKPIWWQSRFSFTFCFFLISIAFKTLLNIDKTEMKLFYKISFLIIITLLISIGFMEYFTGKPVNDYHYFFVSFSALILIEMFFMIDKRLIPIIFILTIVDLNINAFNSLKQNSKYRNVLDNYNVVLSLEPSLKKIDKENKYFYRFEILDDYSSDDGLLFGYNGINYFNSARNVNVVYFLKNIGLKASDFCHTSISILDPFVLSLLNVKYIYGPMDYYKETKYSQIRENNYPLALGFRASNDIKSLKLKDYTKEENDTYKYVTNTNNLVNALTGKNYKMYKVIKGKDYKYKHGKAQSDATYSFKADKDYIIFSKKYVNVEVTVNNNPAKQNYIDKNVLVKKGDNVTINYSSNKKTILESENVLFDISEYEKAMKDLSKNLLKVKKKHSLINILDAEITMDKKGVLFTTMEYEKGMIFFVDGKRVKPNILFNTLVSLDLDKGKHTIKAYYIPKGFIPGLTATLLGLYLANRWKRNYNNVGEKK